MMADFQKGLRIYFVFVVAVAFLLMPLAASAEAVTSYIHLEDGTILYGEVLSLSGGIYTIKTESLGILQVEQARVITISVEKPGSSPASARPGTGSRVGDATSTNLRIDAMKPTSGSAPDAAHSATVRDVMGSGIQNLQSQLMSNPKLLAEIQALMDDPEIMKIISDGNLISVLMNLDPSSARNDPQIRKLMSNPAFRRVMQIIREQVAGSDN